MLYPQKTPHTSPWQMSYGVSFLNICENFDRVITALHCIRNPIVEIRQSRNCLISTMGFPTLVRRHFYIESGPWGIFYWHGLTEMKAWISNHTHNFMQDVITHPLHSLNDGAVEARACIPLFYMDVITYPCPNPNTGSDNLWVKEAIGDKWWQWNGS